MNKNIVIVIVIVIVLKVAWSGKSLIQLRARAGSRAKQRQCEDYCLTAVMILEGGGISCGLSPRRGQSAVLSHDRWSFVGASGCSL